MYTFAQILKMKHVVLKNFLTTRKLIFAEGFFKLIFEVFRWVS